MENKTLRSVLLALVVVVLVVCAFGGGFAAGHFLPIGTLPVLTNTTPTTTANQGGTPQDLQQLFGPFWQAWTLVHQQYVDQPVDDTKLMQGAISGMMSSLGDPFTNYFDPQTYQAVNGELSGQYTGIGAFVDVTGAYLTITKPIEGSPAQKAGLQAGDEIIAVDGQDMTGVNPAAVREKVIGPAGTTVTLTIQRQDVTSPFDVVITRANIVVPSVTSKMLANGIAYIQLSDFGQTSAQDFHAQLQTLMANHPKGLILDLRDNGGGLVTTAVAIGSEFIDHGVIFYEVTANGTKQPHPAQPNGLATQIPLVVLVNSQSASASEIVSGAIQDDGRGKLVGEVTYGKGSEQIMVPLMNNQGAAHITVARWLTPNGRSTNKKGLTPDVIVPLTPDDAKAGRDPQLDAAVKLLTSP
ncbi:MAG: S41 family peptidase [Anaerolineales bacterium]|jgi:carboxyl-terminal processing protease